MDKETNQARGFGFVAFYNNAAATLALRRLSRPEFRLRGHTVQVMWADPKRDEIGTERVRERGCGRGHRGAWASGVCACVCVCWGRRAGIGSVLGGPGVLT